jgi:hypothetical protein
MEETPRMVRLADGAPFDVSARGVTATLLRADIEEAARSGAGPAELVLDVRRGEGADVEAHMVAVEWSPADLERLLDEGDADEVAIAFDRAEIAAAIDAEADVEAHGLREKALVLTVVAVSAASTAGVAQARPAAVPAGTAATVASSPAPAQSPAATIGGAGLEPTDVVTAPAASPATTTGGATASQAPSPSQSPATTMGGARVGPVAESPGGQAGSAGSSSSLSAAEEAALAGAAGLVIAAAGFAAAGRRRRPIQPA